MLVLIKITYCNTHTALKQYRKSPLALKIRSAGHMRPAGL